jgi:hypothetical protein
MSEVITPGTGQTVITTDEHRRHGDRLIENEVRTGNTADALAAAHTNEFLGSKIGGDYASLQKQISDAATSTLVGFKDQQALAYQVQGQNLLEAAKNAAAILVDAAKNTAAVSLQATTNFNLLTVQNSEMKYALLLDSTKNAAASQLEAERNAARQAALSNSLAATAAAQAAECCCELKSAIAASERRIETLIENNRIESLRDQLAQARGAYAAAFIGKVAPVTPAP